MQNNHADLALFTDRPLAAPGLLSFRCKGNHNWIMIGAKDQADALVQAKRSCEEARECNLQTWNGLAYEPCPVEDVHLLKAQVYGVVSPGGTHKELYDVTLDVTNPDATVMFKRVGSPGAVQYWQLQVRDTTLSFPPDDEDLCGKINKAILCHIPATFRPQVWIEDNTLNLEHEMSFFNALPALISMELPAVIAMFEEDCDYDCLSSSQPAREAHDGPFEVDIEEAAVIEMVNVLAGIHAHAGEELQTSIGQVNLKAWNSFCKAAKGILNEQREVLKDFERVNAQLTAEAAQEEKIIDAASSLG